MTAKPNHGQRDKRYLIIREAQAEIKIERSRFIGQSWLVTQPDQIREKLQLVNQAHPDATHLVYAWRIEENQQQFFSDGGEPSGSAGRPILGAIQKAGYTNLLLTVVRYFGGKKLGIKGLIRAYRQTAQAALEKSGKKPYLSLKTGYLTVNPAFFPLVVNRLSALLGGKKYLQIEAEQLLIYFVVPEEKVPLLRQFLEEGKEKGEIVSYDKGGATPL